MGEVGSDAGPVHTLLISDSVDYPVLLLYISLNFSVFRHKTQNPQKWPPTLWMLSKRRCRLWSLKRRELWTKLTSSSSHLPSRRRRMRNKRRTWEISRRESPPLRTTMIPAKHSSRKPTRNWRTQRSSWLTPRVRSRHSHEESVFLRKTLNRQKPASSPPQRSSRRPPRPLMSPNEAVKCWRTAASTTMSASLGWRRSWRRQFIWEKKPTENTKRLPVSWLLQRLILREQRPVLSPLRPRSLSLRRNLRSLVTT